MRTTIYRGPGLPLSVETVDDPTPADGEVVLRVGRCGICGTDLSMTADGPIQYEIGAALGHEFAGEIVAIGKGVDGLRLGDHVVALPVFGCGQCRACLDGEPFFCASMRPMMGGFGEYVVAKAAYCLRLPSGLSFADGAIVEPLAVGRHAVQLSGLAPGARVIVLGAGPIALATAFWARRMGAGKVIVAARSDARAGLAAEMGAHDFQRLDGSPSDEPSPDIVFECVGAPGVLAQAVNMVRPRGVVVLVGLCLQTDPWTPGFAVFKEARIQSAIGYSFADFTAALDALSTGAHSPRAMVSETISLPALPDRFDALRHDHSACKLLVDPWQN